MKTNDELFNEMQHFMHTAGIGDGEIVRTMQVITAFHEQYNLPIIE